MPWVRLGIAWPVLVLGMLSISGCGVPIYNFGGHGKGSDFYIPMGAASNGSPVVQSWIAYSLARSTCQLGIGGDKPYANTSFDCELRPRRVLVERWSEKEVVIGEDAETDAYLDLLVRIYDENLLHEYVWVYLRDNSWIAPEGLELERFDSWRRENLGWHRPKTRIIGYWTNPK